MSELEQCPFCGGEAHTYRTMAQRYCAICNEPFCANVGPFCGGEAHTYRTMAQRYCAICNEPFCANVGPFDTEAEAIAAWNTRAQTVFGMTLDEVRQMMKRDAERTCLNADDDETDAWFMCSECECHVLIDYMGGGFRVPRYCPNCGAKVIESS